MVFLALVLNRAVSGTVKGSYIDHPGGSFFEELPFLTSAERDIEQPVPQLQASITKWPPKFTLSLL